MKLQETTNTIEKIGNISNESQFKMKTSRKAFQILSDLYSDKPLAIVRELGCNASDSMVAAGKAGQPFHIHLPNPMEPWLAIQDFGTGISHEDIYNIYTVYFESTKTNTNSQIGCLGLGSKSPFCYSDNFVVTSIHNGIKSIYNAFFNESNTPAIALMSKENTKEDNGVAIQIPVKRDDFTSFQNAVQKAFRFFDVKPTISGGTINWKNESPIFEGDGWESYEGFSYNEAFAIMGGVTYPIDTYLVSAKMDNHREFLRRGGLVLKFEIGELDFVPSREALSYCEQTINAIKSKMDFVVSDLKVKLEQVIESKTNILDAIRTLSNLRSKFEYYSGINFDGITWRKINISNPVALINTISNKSNIFTHSYSKYSKRKFRESKQITFETKAQWYYDDLDRGTTSRIKSYLRNNPDSVMCIFPMDAYNALTNNSNPDLCFDKSLFKATSSLPKAFRAPVVRGTGGNKISGLRIYTMGSTWLTTWDSQEFDSQNPPKYYIVKNTSDWNFSVRPKGMMSFSTKSELIRLCNSIGIDSNDIVMVTSRNEKYLNGLSTDLQTHINSLKCFNFNADDVATYKKYQDKEIEEFKKNKSYKVFSQNNPNHDFVKFVDKVSESVAKIIKYNSVSDKIISNGKAYEPESNNPLVNFLIKKIGTYGWEQNDILFILENSQK